MSIPSMKRFGLWLCLWNLICQSYPLIAFLVLTQVPLLRSLNWKRIGANFPKKGATKYSTYQSVLNKFEQKLGTNGPQRDCYIALLLNISLIYYRKEEYHQSETCATKSPAYWMGAWKMFPSKDNDTVQNTWHFFGKQRRMYWMPARSLHQHSKLRRNWCSR